MINLKWAWPHLKRILATLGASIVVVIAAGLLLASWSAQGLTYNPLTHAALAVIAVLPILFALVAVPLIVSRFLRDLYDLKTLQEAHSFLNCLIFRPWTLEPHLVVKNGKIAKGEGSILNRVGGPGRLLIHNDSAVVTERCGRLTRVLGAGFPQLERFERVWEIIDLRPQRWRYPVRGMTWEGIPVVCEADISFKIDDQFQDTEGREQTKTPTSEAPYPYTEEAVFRAATSKWIREPDWKGPPMDWVGRVVLGFTEGILRNILSGYRLDWLIASPQLDQKHPREEIRQRLDKHLRERVGTVGAKILQVELGEIRFDDEITSQLIEAWQAEWERQAIVTLAEGEAELSRADVARVQAQAEMVITLTEALQSVGTSQGAVEPYLLATRFVETLRWMSCDPSRREFMSPKTVESLKRIQDTLSAEGLPPDEQVEKEEQPVKEARST